MRSKRSNSGERTRAVDVHAGRRLHQIRVLRGVSQEQLAGALGLTFQQVQKYENGVNRISASRLFDLSRLFDVPVQWFFDEMPGEIAANALAHVSATKAGVHHKSEDDPMYRSETLKLIRYYAAIPKPHRRQVFKLAQTLADA
jgi:transcriptional regulator with XRE-family HTH domain